MQASLRGLILAAAQQPYFRALMTTGPGRRLANRFVAGETLRDAIRVTRRLVANGSRVSLDFLGEAIASLKEAEAAAATYHQTLAALGELALDASISVKPSHFGVDLDYRRCKDLISAVASAASRLPATVRLDMEGSAYTELTLRLWHDLREEHPNLGIVLQASLRRTGADLEKALAAGATIRLCKGAYAEPAHIAYPRKSDVDTQFERLMRRLLDAAAALPPVVAGNEPRAAIATHDSRLIALARKYVLRRAIGADRYEFQMLYGVRRDLQAHLLAAGEPLRVYVPWGPAWYPYLSRRLAERPANIVFFGRSLLSELLSRRDGRMK